MSTIKKNNFKQALRDGQQLIGLWVGLANSYSAELVASTGFDWLLIDGEHAPNNVPIILQQLQAVAAYPASHPVVRPPVGNTVLIKQLLDIGAQTLLVPMVETAAQAKELIDAMHYPPHGVRGVGSALARASLWNGVSDYLNKADEEMCLLVQVENLTGLQNLPEIAAIEGVDGVFIGPADLSATMGHRGNPMHPDVQAAIAKALSSIRQAGKAAGILFADEQQAKQYLRDGFQFVAVGVDTSLLANACRQLRARYIDSEPTATAAAKTVY